MHITGFTRMNRPSTLPTAILRILPRLVVMAITLGFASLVLAQTNVGGTAIASAPTNVMVATQFGVGEMFMQSHIVVKAVMVFLAVLSLITWTVFVEKSLLFARARNANLRFLKEFRSASQTREMRDFPVGNDQSAMGRMWLAAREEIEHFRKTHATMPSTHQADRLLQRMALSAGIIQDRELSRLGSMLGVLATIGSTSPFIGLFGTVWGILNSFAHIAVAKSTNLAVVAPGIAEALLATAIGLFAAIPAVMIYNKFTRDINGFVGALDNFSAEMIATASRKFDAAA